MTVFGIFNDSQKLRFESVANLSEYVRKISSRVNNGKGRAFDKVFDFLGKLIWL